MKNNNIGCLAFLVALVSLCWMTYDLQLRNRPYLYVIPNVERIYNYSTSKSPNNSKVLIGIKFYNEGNIPASNIKVEWYIADDYGPRIAPEQFYKDTFGKTTEYRVIFPNQKLSLPVYKPDISPSTKKVIVKAKVYYEGMNRKFWFFGPYKKYWYDYQSEYEVYYDKDNKIKGYTQIYENTDWDKRL